MSRTTFCSLVFGGTVLVSIGATLRSDSELI